MYTSIHVVRTRHQLKLLYSYYESIIPQPILVEDLMRELYRNTRSKIINTKVANLYSPIAYWHVVHRLAWGRLLLVIP